MNVSAVAVSRSLFVTVQNVELEPTNVVPLENEIDPLAETKFMDTSWRFALLLSVKLAVLYVPPGSVTTLR